MNERFETSELIFDGHVAKGYKVHLRMPDGNVVQRDFIHYDGAAVVLPVLADGSIVLIRNYRFAVDEHLYELPAGMLECWSSGILGIKNSRYLTFTHRVQRFRVESAVPISQNGTHLSEPKPYLWIRGAKSV